ncbi:MAG: hypothetical protein MRJ92_12095 [Nitrospira sp.]|nr:hypothetical protein [Nitrospira sp.]
MATSYTLPVHPAPAYWDDPRLNKAHRPVVGVNWIDAKSYCEFRGSVCRPGGVGRRLAGPNGNLYPGGNDFDSGKANYDRHHGGAAGGLSSGG